MGRIKHQYNFIAAGNYNKICFNRSAAIVTGYFNCISGSFAGEGVHTGNIIGGGTCHFIKDSFKSNLNVVLSYYEEIEEYEKCSHTLNLINKI